MERKKRKICDLINIKEWEVKISIIITIVLGGVFLFVDLYGNFYEFQNMIVSNIECLLGALIGLLGLSLSGIAIIVSLFSKDESRLIWKINGENLVTQILSSYVFMAENVALQCVILIILNILITSRLPIVNIYFFYILVVLEVYHLCFIIFYTVALIRNCIKISEIKDVYSELDEKEKTEYDIINEIKIDYIFHIILGKNNITLEELVEDLITVVNNSQIDDKEKIIRYIKQQYNIK